METLWQDLRYGVRTLVRKPGVTAVAVVALALGIGANTAMFSIVGTLLLRPLPFKNLDRLVMVWGTLPQSGNRFDASPADFLDWRNEQQVFERLAAYQWWDCNLTGAGEPERVPGCLITQNFFPALGVGAWRGRTFLPEEEQPGRDNVVLLSQEFWQRRFAADPNVVGQTIALNGRNYTVVGVMSAEFEWPTGVEVWAPLALTNEAKRDREQHYLQIMGRIRPGLTQAHAQAEMEIITRRLAESYPRTNASRGVKLVRLPGYAADDFARPFLLILMGAVVFVLLIACANVANLQLARATSRQKEIAIRAALGATRWRVMRQLLTESLLLALMGAALGLLLAMWGVDLGKSYIPPDIVRFVAGLKQAGIDGRSLGYTLLIALLTGIVSGLAPALQTSKPDLNETLKAGGRDAGAGRHPLRSVLVVAEVALALVLLVGTGLMVKGFARQLSNQKQGFDPTHLLTLNVALPESKYRTTRERVDFYERALERIKAQSGVEAAAAISHLPASNGWDHEFFSIEGRAALSPAEMPLGDFEVVSPDYFRTLRIPLVKGREFTAQDGESATPVAIISESLARRFWPERDPLGQRLRLEQLNADQAWLTIVGVIGDVKQFIFDREPRLMIYQPYAQAPSGAMNYGVSLAVRASGDPLSLAKAVREQIRSVDRDQPLTQVKTMEHLIREHLAPISLSASYMAVFAAIALVLSAVGVYSVMAYSVTQRTHEIGIRMALGAQASDVLRMIVGQSFKLAFMGLAIGLPISFTLTKVMSSLLVGVIALDLSTFAGFSLLLVAVALLSGYLPARKAAQVDPMIALRYE